MGAGRGEECREEERPLFTGPGGAAIFVGVATLPPTPRPTVMTLNELIREGEALSRKCFYLSRLYNIRGVMGYWGGERSDITNWLEPGVTSFVSRRHIATVSESLFASLGIERLGPVGAFEWLDEEKNSFYRVEFDSRKKFDSFRCDGAPLYATEAMSFPPLAAVCLYGGEKIEQWLGEMGRQRFEYQLLLSEPMCEEYQAEFARRSVLKRDDVDIVVGGWHELWPEDEYYTPAELRLLYMTLRDAEPWIEVWHNPARASCFAKPRIA
jgi:hypothetical protein